MKIFNTIVIIACGISLFNSLYYRQKHIDVLYEYIHSNDSTMASNIILMQELHNTDKRLDSIVFTIKSFKK